MLKLMSVSPGIPSSSPLTPQPPSPPPAVMPQALPVRSIPGGYGWPLLGPLSDRLDYFWFQGPETFFRKRIKKHESTVFRTNMPPTFPFFLGVNPNVVAVLDCKSFATLFDSELVDKSNVLVGDFMPSLNFTGGLRVCAYLDTTDPQHTKIKNFSLDILKRSSGIWVSELVSSLDAMCDTFEAELTNKGSAGLNPALQQFIFRFFTKCLIGADPASSPEIAESGYVMLDKWLALQLSPVVNVGALEPLVEIFLHSFTYPFFLVSGDYKKLVEFVEREGKEVIERGKTEFGLSQKETIHNLLFILGFNAFGGFSIFFPALINALGSDKTGLQERLKKEVREVIGSNPSGLSFDSVGQMELVQALVYETLRCQPPVPLQYGRARKDFELSSHDAVYKIKKGELLCGYQKLAMRDPKVFDDPETFNPERFTKEKGRQLLSYLYWSNGPQTESPSAANKQCAAKDHVIITASIFVAHLLLRYDSITATSSSVTALEKAK